MMAARSITTILGWGGSASAGVVNSDAAGMAKPARASARTVFFIWVPCRLVACGSAEVDDLGPIIAGFNIGQAEVDLDRAEGRLPLYADTGRAAEGQIVPHTGPDAGILGAGTDPRPTQRVQPAHGAEEGEQRQADPVAFRQKRGEAHLRRANGAHRAAQRTGIVGSDNVARPDTGQGKAAEGVAAVEKAL